MFVEMPQQILICVAGGRTQVPLPSLFLRDAPKQECQSMWKGSQLSSGQIAWQVVIAEMSGTDNELCSSC